jgi:hypothetical protein
MEKDMEPRNHRAVLTRTDALHEQVRDYLLKYPYLAVAAGTGLGFLLAGGLASRKTRRVLGAIGSLALFSPVWSRLITSGLSMATQPRRT